MNRVEAYERVIFPFLMKIDPKFLHEAAVSSLAVASESELLLSLIRRLATERLKSERLNINFGGTLYENPLFLAAGFDKDARATKGLLALNFGGLEIGSVLSHDQKENEGQTLFRVDNQGIVNRLGFPSKGLSFVKQKLQPYQNSGLPVGISVGINRFRVFEDAAVGYAEVIEELYDLGNYFVINLSSPNTKGLRELQKSEYAREIIATVMGVAKVKGDKPIYLKVSPDEEERDLVSLIELALELGIRGFVAVNTSKDHRYGEGGISGRPLRKKATKTVSKIREIGGSQLEIAACGGVDSLEAMLEKFEAGGRVVQIFSSLVYKGPSFPSFLLRQLDQWMKQRGVRSIEELIGERIT